MISIAGLGVSGSYLLRRFVGAGYDVGGFEPRRPDFYLPCGYAVNLRSMGNYMKNVGIEIDPFIESESHNVEIASTDTSYHFGSLGLGTVDKNRLIRNLLEGMPVEHAQLHSASGHITVDATGISRSLLGPAREDFTMIAKEYLCNDAEHSDFYFRYFPGGNGYYWEFPLRNRWHIGAGSPNLDIIEEELGKRDHILVTGRRIRLKPLFDGIRNGNVFGIGEAIGAVSPITGEGIMPSIKTAECLFEAVSRYSDLQSVEEAYSRCVRKEIGYFEDLFALLMDARSGNLRKIRNLRAGLIAGRDFREFGIDFRLTKVLSQFI